MSWALVRLLRSDSGAAQLISNMPTARFVFLLVVHGPRCTEQCFFHTLWENERGHGLSALGFTRFSRVFLRG